MTPAEAYKNEVDAIVQRTGRHIPPYRLANLMKSAQKVMDFITKADVCVTYEESLLVLRIVTKMIEDVTGESGEGR